MNEWKLFGSLLSFALSIKFNQNLFVRRRAAVRLFCYNAADEMQVFARSRCFFVYFYVYGRSSKAAKVE